MASPAKTVDEKLTEGLGGPEKAARTLRAFHALADRLVQAVHLDEDSAPALRCRTHRRAVVSAKLDADVEYLR